MAQLPLLDLLFVDGGHTYDVVVEDLLHYLPRLRTGGLLVVDDCGNSLNVRSASELQRRLQPEQPFMPKYMGWPQVTKAVDETLPPKTPHPHFKHLFAIWTTQVWRKVGP